MSDERSYWQQIKDLIADDRFDNRPRTPLQLALAAPVVVYGAVTILLVAVQTEPDDPDLIVYWFRAALWPYDLWRACFG